jgi:dTMP kinase
MFITIEGPDGSGKTTQVNEVFQILSKMYPKVIRTREPGGTPVAEEIRRILLNPESNLDSYTEVLLHFAARRDHINNLIKPKLDDGYIVICDRFYDSTMAYQHYGLGVPSFLVYTQIERLPVKPDLTIMLSVPWETCVERRMKRDEGKNLDRYEKCSDDFSKRVYDGYNFIAAMNKDRCVKVDNSESGHGSNATNKIIKMIEDRIEGFNK